MTEADRAAMCRGTVTSGIDLDEVRRYRDQLAAARQHLPEKVEAGVSPSTLGLITIGVIVGCLVSLTSQLLA